MPGPKSKESNLTQRQQKLIRRAGFTSRENLARRILAFIEYFNKEIK